MLNPQAPKDLTANRMDERVQPGATMYSSLCATASALWKDGITALAMTEYGELHQAAAAAITMTLRLCHCKTKREGFSFHVVILRRKTMDH